MKLKENVTSGIHRNFASYFIVKYFECRYVFNKYGVWHTETFLRDFFFFNFIHRPYRLLWMHHSLHGSFCGMYFLVFSCHVLRLLLSMFANIVRTNSVKSIKSNRSQKPWNMRTWGDGHMFNMFHIFSL